MRLTLTPLAEQDLETIGDYIAADNPTRAVSFIRILHGARDILALYVRQPQDQKDPTP
jgi:toxin ParE1/3/4